MNAPTPRETADHAELARLAEAAKRVRRAAVGRLDGEDAVRIWGAFLGAMSPATVLALLSEMAALRGEKDRVGRVLTTMQEAIPAGYHPNGSGLRLFIADLKDRATQAERQRDEARDTIASTVAKADWMQGHLSGERSSIDRETIELVVSECRAYCHLQALANQGADQ